MILNFRRKFSPCEREVHIEIKTIIYHKRKYSKTEKNDRAIMIARFLSVTVLCSLGNFCLVKTKKTNGNERRTHFNFRGTIHYSVRDFASNVQHLQNNVWSFLSCTILNILVAQKALLKIGFGYNFSSKKSGM